MESSPEEPQEPLSNDLESNDNDNQVHTLLLLGG